MASAPDPGDLTPQPPLPQAEEGEQERARRALLRWRLVLGWHPDSPAARSAPKLMEMAQESYQEVVARNPMYVEWMADYPHLGGHRLAAA